MKNFFYIVSLLLFVSVFCYANDDADMFVNETALWNEFSNSQERQNSLKELRETMRDVYKDASPEEKAIYRKLLEEQKNASIALMEVQHKKTINNMDMNPEQKKHQKICLKHKKRLWSGHIKKI